MSGGMYLFVDCWECELYVSRLALVQWWNEGTELRQKMCRLQGYLSDFGLGLGSEGKVPF